MIAPLTFAAVALLLAVLPVAAAERLDVTWHPSRPRVGDVTWVQLRGVAETAVVEGSLGGQSLRFFPYAGGQAALAGLDIETKAGSHRWTFAVLEPGRPPRMVKGHLRVGRRDFPLQRLTVPPGMADLDPETERRANAEAEQLRALYRTASADRLWRGPFTRPVAGEDAATGFGARRIINGQRRLPHGGADYAAGAGTPVVAANSGRVALVAEFFFPGRLVAVDHGLGLYTVYFHLGSVAVAAGEPVERGQPLGTVGATGRATGPHLHFGVQLGGARVDPARLLALRFRD